MRRALGCWGRISSAGAGDGEGGRARDGLAPGDANLGGRGGRRARRSGARPCLELQEDSPGKRSSPQPASRRAGVGGGCLQTEKENLGPRPRAKSSQGVCRNRGKLCLSFDSG